MIDIENELFTRIASKLRLRFNGISVYGEDVNIPSSFPCVSIVEIDNYPLEETQDSGNMENHTNLVYEVNVYSNKGNGKKAECKSILSVIDDEFNALGFTRKNKNQLTMNDATICRMLSRYGAVVSKDKTIYRR